MPELACNYSTGDVETRRCPFGSQWEVIGLNALFRLLPHLDTTWEHTPLESTRSCRCTLCFYLVGQKPPIWPAGKYAIYVGLLYTQPKLWYSVCSESGGEDGYFFCKRRPVLQITALGWMLEKGRGCHLYLGLNGIRLDLSKLESMLLF